ncbi:hypothetical protein [Nocardia fluminea]
MNAQPLRCYERRGLLTEPDRALVGHRQSPEQACLSAAKARTAQ